MFKQLYDLQNVQASGWPAAGGRTTWGGGMTTGYAPLPIAPPQPSGRQYMPPGTPPIPREPPVVSRIRESGGRLPSPYQPPKITPFLWNMLSNIKTMDVDSRSEYLEATAAGIKDKLDSFSMRLARGVPLTPEQQTRYNSLQNAFNDIQRYMTNQTVYDEYLARLGERTPEQYAAQQAKPYDPFHSGGIYQEW